MSEERTAVCDCCGEEWEESFFCEICSDDGELVEVEGPRAFYDGHGPDMETTEEWVFWHTCFNCCGGHKVELVASTPAAPWQGFDDDEEIPF